MRTQFILWLSAITMAAASALAAPPTGQEAGLRSASLVQQRFGTPDSLTTQLVTPLVSGQPLETVDGQQRFSTPLFGGVQPELLRLIVQPGESGDLTRLIISLNRRGADETPTVTTITRPIAGVCTNGIISCDLGSWDRCTPYTYQVTSDDQVTLQQGTLRDLSGCFCINRSCGENLYWRNRAQVLTALGGGIVLALQRETPRFAVSTVTLEDSTIRYGGRLVTPGQSALTGLNDQIVPTSTPAAEWLTQPTTLSQARDQLLTPRARTDQGSLVAALDQRAMTNGLSGVASFTCQTTRTAALVPITEETRQTVQTTLCTDHLIYSIIRQDQNQLLLELLDTGPAGLGAAHQSCPTGDGTDGWHTLIRLPLQQELIDSVPLLQEMRGTISMSGSGCSSASQTIDSSIQANDTPLLHPVICGASGPQTATVSADIISRITSIHYQEQYHDGCALYRQRQDCSLQESRQDGVVLVFNGRSTGLTALPSCKTIAADETQMLVCRPFWQMNERYLCQGEAQPTPDTTVLDRVKASSSGTEQTLYYQDLKQQSQQVSLPAQPAANPCQATCRVRQVSTRSQVTSDGPVSNQVLQGASSSRSGLRLCQEGGCPLLDDETIERPCGCDGELGRSFANLAVLEAAGADLICSPTGATP